MASVPSALALLLLLACAALPAAAMPRRMLLDANLTVSGAPVEEANSSAPIEPVTAPLEQDALQASNASVEHATSSPPSAPPAPPFQQAVPTSSSSKDVTDKLVAMVERYCQQEQITCSSITTSKVSVAEDGFTPVQLSAPTFNAAAFAALACAYSDTPYKCQIDLTIDVEQKASSTTTGGFSVDSRVG